MEIDVLYEDSETLVINKPVDMIVNRAESIKGETVQDWVEGQGWYEKLKNSKPCLPAGRNQKIKTLTICIGRGVGFVTDWTRKLVAV